MGNPRTTIGLDFFVFRKLYLAFVMLSTERERSISPRLKGCITNEDGEKNHEWIEYPEDMNGRMCLGSLEIKDVQAGR